ncbi:MAG: hypothetical protein ACYC0B_03855 [Gemmatimonadaceae bacterium]
MRRVIAVVLLLLANQSLEAQQRRVRIGIIGHRGPVAVDSLATIVTINGSTGATYRALAQVFAELKIPVDVQDSTRGLIGVTNVRRMGTFGNARISRYLNCGSGMTGLNADNWRVEVTALAFLEKADSATTTLRLAMVGGAQDVAGSSTIPVACGTTGVFESVVTERVKARLGSPE